MSLKLLLFTILVMKNFGRPEFNPGCRGGGDFSSLLRDQTGPGIHSAAYKINTEGFLRW